MIPEATGAPTARAAWFHPLVLLAVGLVTWPDEWDAIHTWLNSARSPETSPASRERHAVGYYGELIRGTRGSSGSRFELSGRLIGKPDAWGPSPEVDLVRSLDDDFLQFELRPAMHQTLFGQPFVTNAFGMHDDDVALEKPAGTFRIAVLGASIDMGWGVKYQDTYLHLLQEWLDAHAQAARSGATGPRRFEVLNFAVMEIGRAHV